MKPRRKIIAFTLVSVIAASLLLLGAVLLSPAARWNFGLYLGQRDYDDITNLRDRFEQNPTNLALLDKIVARTKHPNPFSRGNAIGVLSQLSFYNSPTGKQIHTTVLPIFVRALDEEDQDIQRTALEGLENLGPYAIPAIPDIKKKLNGPDLIIQQEAQKVLVTSENYQNH